MWLVVGLGNPGSGYAQHRHNAGFMAVDALAHTYHATSFSKKFHGECADVTIASEKCLLLKPQTFMNLSGKAVLAAAQFYKIAPEKILVLHDELDLPLAKLRIKQGGGHGGHNGLRDIDSVMGQNYWRLRMGIGHPGNKDMVHSYVLSPFSSEERPVMQEFLTSLAAHLALFWQKSPAALMSKLALENE